MFRIESGWAVLVTLACAFAAAGPAEAGESPCRIYNETDRADLSTLQSPYRQVLLPFEWRDLAPGPFQIVPSNGPTSPGGAAEVAGICKHGLSLALVAHGSQLAVETLPFKLEATAQCVRDRDRDPCELQVAGPKRATLSVSGIPLQPYQDSKFEGPLDPQAILVDTPADMSLRTRGLVVARVEARSGKEVASVPVQIDAGPELKKLQKALRAHQALSWASPVAGKGPHPLLLDEDGVGLELLNGLTRLADAQLVAVTTRGERSQHCPTRLGTVERKQLTTIVTVYEARTGRGIATRASARRRSFHRAPRSRARGT